MLSDDACVGVTIGNFDGMHLGHQELFRRLQLETAQRASALGKRPVAVLLTFAPHPREVLARLYREPGTDAPASPEGRVTSLRCKARLAAAQGFDLFYAVKFNRAFSSLTPETFARQCLKGTLHASHLVIGYDWSFGKGRSGNAQTLTALGEDLGFTVSVIEPVEGSNGRYSSTLVKDALARGALQELRDLLGRTFAVSGHVVKGEQRGRQLGFPTANLRLQRQLLPPDGIYATRSRIDDAVIDSVTNVGLRPTFGGGERLVETFLMDNKSHKLYGKYLRLEFLEWLRPELKFADAEELKEAMAKDVRDAEEVHRRFPQSVEAVKS